MRYIATCVSDPSVVDDVVKPAVKFQHKTFLQYGVAGNRVLDVGSGPCVHFALVPAQHFHEVYLSDYVSRNRQVLTDWKEQPDKAYDVTPLTQHVASLYGNVKPPAFYEDMLRQRIKGVLPIDILLEDPLLGQTVPQFDCITTSACLEGACTNLQDFEQSLKKLMKYLKPGGYFFHVTYNSDEFYMVDDARFDTLCLNSSQIKQAHVNAGLKPLFYEEQKFRTCVDRPDKESAGIDCGLWILDL